MLDVVLEPGTRQRFVQDMTKVVTGAGQDVRLFYLPRLTDEALVVDEVGNLITFATPPVMTPLGNGVAAAFDGSAVYGVIPDADKFSFGDGTTDKPFSGFAVINVTDTASTKAILSKIASSNNEWGWDVSSTELMRIFGQDQSAAATAWQRITSTAITIGSWIGVGFSYDGGGGATAADGAVTYEAGAAKASGATNSGTYVAMENLTGGVGIGGTAAGGLPFAGSIGAVILGSGAWNAQVFADLQQRAKAFFALAA